MSGPGDWLAQVSQRWLDQFRKRHGLPSQSSSSVTSPTQRVMLHVGCGGETIQNVLLKGFQGEAWQEVRLDADPAVQPDIIGTMVDMSTVVDNFADVLFSSHGIEHLYWHDVPLAFAEFRRTLKESGFAIITCPDVQAAAEMIAQDRMFDVAYQSGAGPITPFDILYSYRPFVKANPQWMSHHCGFTLSTLIGALKEAGFSSIYGIRRIGAFDLWVLASKCERSPEEMRLLAADFLPVAQ